jgi:DNA-binding response OmpR family regulator
MAGLIESLGLDDPAPIATARTILVVDDDEDIVSMLSMLLDVEGYAVLSASGGRDGVGLIQTHRPDLVLVDGHMLRGSGADLVKAVRAEPQIDRTPLLYMSALEPDPTLDVAWVKKPFEVDELLERIRQILDTAESTAAAEAEKDSGT